MIPNTGGKAPSLDALIERLIISFKEEATQAQINWKPNVREPEGAYYRGAVPVLPDEEDLDQEEALRIAIHTVCTLSDTTPQDIFDKHEIAFYFYTDSFAEKRYWYITIQARIGTMGTTDNFHVEVLTTDGKVNTYARFNNG